MLLKKKQFCFVLGKDIQTNFGLFFYKAKKNTNNNLDNLELIPISLRYNLLNFLFFLNFIRVLETIELIYLFALFLFLDLFYLKEI